MTNEVDLASRLGAIIALEVDYREDIFVGSMIGDSGIAIECASDFAAYCVQLGKAIESWRVPLQAEGDFYPVDVAEEMGTILNAWGVACDLQNPAHWAKSLCKARFQDHN